MRSHEPGYRANNVPPIVCAIDDKYVGALCVLMQSLAMSQHEPDRVRLIVLHNQLTPPARRKISFHADRLGLSLDLRNGHVGTNQYPVSGWVSRATYLRLTIGHVINEYPTVLYLDADVIVLRDLTPLLVTEIGSAPVAAVRDTGNPVLRVDIGLPGWRALGLPPNREYFNSGVMLVNLIEWRRAEVFEQCDEFLRRTPEYVRFWDQDALNLIVADQWVRLDQCWNTFAVSRLSERPGWRHHAEEVLPLEQLLMDEKKAAVLHFAGPDKPWTSEYPQSRPWRLYDSLDRMVIEAELNERFR